MLYGNKMTNSQFKPYELKLIEPDFDSYLTDLIIELDYLRKKRLQGSTHPKVFFQLKEIFHTSESIGSARIEGNNTTIAEYIDATKLNQSVNISQNIQEILNIEKAMSFVDDYIKDHPVNRLFVSEIHKKIVSDLNPNKEGDNSPGLYRKHNVVINKSAHIPPDGVLINDYMEELFNFINKADKPKYDLLKIAIAHHRFVWIHPFSNGNGRTVRLFTYAMLVKLGFNIGRILNPTAVFCSNRDNYYRYLAEADTGDKEKILIWCEYVLNGLKEEIEKIDKLLDYNFLRRKILLPTINYSLERQHITEMESKILKITLEKQIIQAADLKELYSGKQNSAISRQISRLIDKKMITPISENTRKYIIHFDNNYLLRGIIKMLGDNGFLPIKD